MSIRSFSLAPSRCIGSSICTSTPFIVARFSATIPFTILPRTFCYIKVSRRVYSVGEDWRQSVDKLGTHLHQSRSSPSWPRFLFVKYWCEDEMLALDGYTWPLLRLCKRKRCWWSRWKFGWLALQVCCYENCKDFMWVSLPWCLLKQRSVSTLATRAYFDLCSALPVVQCCQFWPLMAKMIQMIWKLRRCASAGEVSADQMIEMGCEMKVHHDKRSTYL